MKLGAELVRRLPARTMAIAGRWLVDPFGPVFISYRQSDGTNRAIELARALRASGVPVWHDVTDLPPGDTTRRLADALAIGLSGGALIVTPDIVHSNVVREVELPRLLRLERHAPFILGVGNAIVDAGTGIDYTAPDRLLKQRPGTLRRLKQYGIGSESEIFDLTHAIAIQRVRTLAARDASAIVDLHVETRATPQAAGDRSALVLRTDPPQNGDRLPPATVWAPLQSFLRHLPALVAASGSNTLRVSGGAHLSIAFALGTALPETGAVHVEVADREGNLWRIDRSLKESINVDPHRGSGTAPPAVFVDLVDAAPMNDAFRAHALACGAARIVTITAASRGRMSSHAGSRLVVAIATAIRDVVAADGRGTVVLYLRTPFPIALLLGRLVNTLRVRLTEWNGDAGYEEVITVAPGVGDGPVVSAT